MRNIRPMDRFIRALLGIGLLEVGYFWVGSPWNWVSYALGAVLLITALTRRCPLYSVLGVPQLHAKTGSKRPILALLAVLSLGALLIGGSYASIFFTRKLFLEDFNAMNSSYKQALFLTGKGNRAAALDNFDKLKPAFDSFSAKYTAYRPYDLKGDSELTNDFATVQQILTNADPLVRSGDLHEAHLTLENVRPVFQGMFKRDGFSMLAVTLVDFHDAMETILAPATAKDAAGIIAIYPVVSDKLKAVEAEDNDQEIQAIRQALDGLLSSAQSGEIDTLPAKGDTLKASFVKVYLKRG